MTTGTSTGTLNSPNSRPALSIPPLVPDDAETVELLLNAFIEAPDYHGPFGCLAVLLKRNPEVAESVMPRLAEAAMKEAERKPRRPDRLAQFYAMFRFMPRGHADAAKVIEMLEDAARQPMGNDTLKARFALWFLNPRKYNEQVRAEELAKLMRSPNRLESVSAMGYIELFCRPNDADTAMVIADATLDKLNLDPGVTGIGLRVLEYMGTNAVPLEKRIRQLVNPMIGGTNEFNRISALETLWATTHDAGSVLPPLLNDLEKLNSENRPSWEYGNVLRALGKMGPAAMAAAPALRALAEPRDSELRHAAGLALWKIAGEPDHLLEAFKERLTSELSKPQRWKLVHNDELFPLLEELDAHAKPLVPLLVQLAQHRYTLPQTRERTIEVLQKIAPEALDQIDTEIVERCMRYINWKREFEANRGWN